MRSELRLVVGTQGGPRSTSWTAWAWQESFYVAPREMKGAMKVSLHPPSDEYPNGLWLFGFTREYLDAGGEMEPATHPRLERFDSRPLRPGVTRACTVQVPHEVVNWNEPLPRGSKHVWVPPPVAGRARELIFLLLAADLGDPRAAAHPRYLGQISNARGDHLVALHREVNLAERPRLSTDLGPSASEADYSRVRAVSMGVLREDGSCVMTEVAGEPAASYQVAVEEGRVVALLEVDDAQRPSDAR